MMVYNVATLGRLDGLDGAVIDIDDLDLSPLTTAVSDIAKNFAITTSRQIGATHTARLQDFGRRISKSAVGQMVKPLPLWIRNYVMPDYEEPKPLPTWIGEIANPLLNPVVYGAKMEAFERSQRLAPVAITLVFTGILTTFAAGYILGSLTRKQVRAAP